MHTTDTTGLKDTSGEQANIKVTQWWVLKQVAVVGLQTVQRLKAIKV